MLTEKDIGRSIQRSVDVLEQVAMSPEGLPHAEISRHLEIPKSSLTEILKDLLSRGYMDIYPGGRHQIGSRVLMLAQSYLNRVDIVTNSAEALAELSNYGSSGYSCAKGGIVGASRALALALAPYGITVNCIAPGFIDTTMARSLPTHILERVVKAIPVGRTGTVDDVSELVKLLASPNSGYITGQTYVVCGGRSISNPITDASQEKNA